jgi:hypothetical protein
MAALRSVRFLVDYITDTAAFEFATGTGGKAGSRIYRVSRRASGYGCGFQGQQGDQFDARRARQVVCEVGTGFAAPMRGVSLARKKVGRPIGGLGLA